MNDEFLKKHQKKPRPEFSEALYKRISTMSPETTPKRTFRPVFALLTLALAFILLIAASPQAQAYVESVMRQIGIINISNDEQPEIEVNPNEAALPLPDPTSTPIPSNSSTNKGTQGELETVEEMTTALGFRPLQPEYLPEGYTFDKMYPMEYLSDEQKSQGWGSTLAYKTEGAQHFLEIQQSQFTTKETQQFPVGGAAITDVTVRGYSSVWVEQITFETDNPLWDVVNLLLWEEDGFIFALFSDTLPLDEMLKVADSLN